MKQIAKILTVLVISMIAFAACGTPPKAPEKKPEPAVKEEPKEEKPVKTEEPAPEPKKPVVKEPSEVPVQKYTVAAGDTLSQIAFKFYGTREKAYYFPIIMTVNPGVVKHPDKLTPKMVLLVPDFDAFMQHSPSKAKARSEFDTCIGIYERENRSGMVKVLKRRIGEF